MRFQKRYVLSIALLIFLFGMSRPLQYKRATGKLVNNPKGVAMTGVPIGLFGENSNNQGCISTQKLDIVFKYQLVNQTRKPLEVECGKAHIVHNKKSYTVEATIYVPSKGGKTIYPKKTVAIQPGMSGTFTMILSGFLPKKHLKTTKQIQLMVPTSNGTVQLGFEKMNTLKILSGRPALR